MRSLDAAAEAMVHVPGTQLLLGPSDWEAEGRVAPRAIDVRAFDLDAYEATEDELRGDAGAIARAPRTACRSTRRRSHCASRGARVPTEDEWIAAAAGASARRYPWGDTGAVCRRAAWGLASGPCARDARGPTSIGAHPDGDSPLGVSDLAGNVAEWSMRRAGRSRMAGSWQSALRDRAPHLGAARSRPDRPRRPRRRAAAPS